MKTTLELTEDEMRELTILLETVLFDDEHPPGHPLEEVYNKILASGGYPPAEDA